MRGHIYSELTPVRRRQQRMFAVWTTLLSVMAGSVFGGLLGAMRWLIGWPDAVWTGFAVVAAAPIAGLAIGLLWRRSWHGAAAAVDSHYGLKDRTTTALAFLTSPAMTTLQELEVHDAREHLTGVKAHEVVPFRFPRLLPYAAGMVVAAIALLVWPAHSTSLQAESTEPLPEVLAEAERISNDLEQLNELAREERDPELEQLVHELEEMVEAMVQPGVDLKEALAKLSEMEAAIAAQQAQYNVGLVDGQLQSLGHAMMTAQPLEGAGKAMQEAKYDRAAKELEELEEPEFDKKEAKAAAEKMKQVADAMGEVGLGEFSEAVSEMCEGMRSGMNAKFQKGSRSLARLSQRQASRKRVYDILDGELARLSECKGNCKNPKNSLVRGKMPQKSLTPSSQFGLATSGNVFGDKTNLLAKRDLEVVTGNPGEGPAEMETMHSPEGREQAGRTYRDLYNKYKKESEAVLDSEPIPLGHRETIRRYFELIRPQNAEEKEAAGAASDASQ